jgi:hypothetical protein
MARLTRTAGQGKRGVLLFGVLLGFGLAMVFNSVVSAYGGGSQVPVVAAQAQQSSQQPAEQQSAKEVQPAKEEEKQEQQQPEHKAEDEKPLCTFSSAAGGGAAPEQVPTPARSNIFKVLQQEGLKVGAELGVQVRVQLPPGRACRLPPADLWLQCKFCHGCAGPPPQHGTAVATVLRRSISHGALCLCLANSPSPLAAPAPAPVRLPAWLPGNLSCRRGCLQSTRCASGLPAPNTTSSTSGHSR